MYASDPLAIKDYGEFGTLRFDHAGVRWARMGRPRSAAPPIWPSHFACGQMPRWCPHRCPLLTSRPHLHPPPPQTPRPPPPTAQERAIPLSALMRRPPQTPPPSIPRTPRAQTAVGDTSDPAATDAGTPSAGTAQTGNASTPSADTALTTDATTPSADTAQNTDVTTATDADGSAAVSSDTKPRDAESPDDATQAASLPPSDAGQGQ
jgi:hypothetical protein